MGGIRFLVALIAAIVGAWIFFTNLNRGPERPDLVVRSSIPSAEFNDWLVNRYAIDHPGVTVGVIGESIRFRLPSALSLGESAFDVMLTFDAAPTDAPPSPRDLDLVAVDTIGFAWREDHTGTQPGSVSDLVGADWDGSLAIGRPADDELAALWLREVETRVAEHDGIESGVAALRAIDAHVRAYTDGPGTTTRALVRGEAAVGLLPASLARGVGLEWRAPSDWTVVLELRTFSEDSGRDFVEWLHGEDITAWLDQGVLPKPDEAWLRLWELNVRAARTGSLPDVER